MGIEKRWSGGARVLKTPGSGSFREAEYELDLPVSAGDGPERLQSFSLSRSPGKVAGKPAGLDLPAGFDQLCSQNAYGGMKHLVCCLKSIAFRTPWPVPRPQRQVGSSAPPLLPCQSVLPALRASAELAVCWPRRWLSHLLNTSIHRWLSTQEAGLPPTRGV